MIVQPRGDDQHATEFAYAPGAAPTFTPAVGINRFLDEVGQFFRDFFGGRRAVIGGTGVNPPRLWWPNAGGGPSCFDEVADVVVSDNARAAQAFFGSDY